MQKPINIGGNIIDPSDVHAVKPVTPEQSATLSAENVTAEIRAIGDKGGYVENLSVADVADVFGKIGEKLTVLPTGEAIRAEWIASIKPFQSRPGQPAKFASVVEFENPANGRRVEESLTATPAQVLAGRARRAGGYATY